MTGWARPIEVSSFRPKETPRLFLLLSCGTFTLAAVFANVWVSRGVKPIGDRMAILKAFALATALMIGASSLAMAQAQGSSGPDGMSTAAAADNPPPPKHHKKMYMSAKGSHHKALKTGQQQPKQPQ